MLEYGNIVVDYFSREFKDDQWNNLDMSNTIDAITEWRVRITFCADGENFIPNSCTQFESFYTDINNALVDNKVMVDWVEIPEDWASSGMFNIILIGKSLFKISNVIDIIKNHIQVSSNIRIMNIDSRR